jgi:lipopolysaccharide/colanic/teichoic acid biosynthesis glycosyltransferase
VADQGAQQDQVFEDWVRLDLEYIDNWSLWLDIKIIITTIPVVLLARGPSSAGPHPDADGQAGGGTYNGAV